MGNADWYVLSGLTSTLTNLCLGIVINYVVMVSVVTSQREVLLSSSGTNIWSGQTVQSLNTNAVTWALAKYLYTPSGPYFVIPMGLFIGMVPTILQRAVAWRWPNLHLGPVHINDVILPLIWSVCGVASRLSFRR